MAERIHHCPVEATVEEYRLTAEGRSLTPVLQAMHDWGRQWATVRKLTVAPVPD